MTIPKSLESLEQQRANIANQIAGLGRLARWLDHIHYRPMWQIELPLSSAQGPRPWPQSPADLQGPWQDGDGGPARSRRNPKGGERNR